MESPDVFFREAIHHVRWKKVIRPHLEKLFENLNDFSRCASFHEIFLKVAKVFGPVKGIGKLATYDTAAAISRHFGVAYDRVYIIGSGPRRAVEQLGVPVHRDRDIRADYCRVEDVRRVFGEPWMTADDLESRLCLFGTGRLSHS